MNFLEDEYAITKGRVQKKITSQTRKNKKKEEKKAEIIQNLLFELEQKHCCQEVNKDLQKDFNAIPNTKESKKLQKRVTSKM